MTQAAVLASNASLMTTPSGTAPGYLARAWVNFNGTGTVAIRASGNVSSITDNGTGLYTVNFTTAIADANFVANGLCGRNTTNGYEFISIEGTSNMTTSSVRVATRAIDQSLIDQAVVCVSIFR
jgi:hypothetical protein